MNADFDPAKDAANRASHGLSLAFCPMVLADADRLVFRDDRSDYGEERFVCFGAVDGRVHVAVYTVRGNVYRFISVRKANARETRRYLAD